MWRLEIRLRQNFGAALFDALRRGEEWGAEVERSRRANSHETHAMPARQVGEAASHVGSAGEQHGLHLAANGGQYRTDLVAAIEDGAQTSIGDRLPRRLDHRSEPARPRPAAGIRRAREHDWPIGSFGCPQRGDRLVKRVDDDNGALGAALIVPRRFDQVGASSVAVVGSIMRRTSVILFAGKPLRLACSRISASSWAR
jgi:hypothetical protein